MYVGQGYAFQTVDRDRDQDVVSGPLETECYAEYNIQHRHKEEHGGRKVFRQMPFDSPPTHNLILLPFKAMTTTQELTCTYRSAPSPRGMAAGAAFSVWRF